MPETMPFGVAHVKGVFAEGEVVLQRKVADLAAAQRWADELTAQKAKLEEELAVVVTDLASKQRRRTDIIARLGALDARERDLLADVRRILFGGD